MGPGIMERIISPSFACTLHLTQKITLGSNQGVLKACPLILQPLGLWLISELPEI